MSSRTAIAALVLFACQDASAPPSRVVATPPVVVQADAGADAGRNACDLFMHYIDHLGRCTKLPEKSRRVLEDAAVQLRRSQPLSGPAAKVCDAALQSLRDATKQLCPQLLEALPEAPD